MRKQHHECEIVLRGLRGLRESERVRERQRDYMKLEEK